MNLRLGHTEVFVKDPMKSKEFYVDVLGFELITVQAEKYVWLKLGERNILLRPGTEKNTAVDYRHTNIAFVIYTDDVDGTVKQYTSKGLVFNGDDGPVNPTFTDLDGNWFQLANPDAK